MYRIPVIFLLAVGFNLSAQNVQRNIRWTSNIYHNDQINEENDEPIVTECLHFEGAEYPGADNRLPWYYELIDAKDAGTNIGIVLENKKFEVVPEQQLSNIKNLTGLPNNIQPLVNTAISRKQKKIQLSFIPLRYNDSTNRVERLTGFTVRQFSTKSTSGGLTPKSLTRSYANNSVLATGKWYKIRIAETGIYKITYDKLVELGFSNPQNIRVYGNGGRQLPYMNNVPRPDDLLNNPVYIHKGGDDTFNSGDYILFYGQGPVTWEYDTISGMYLHNKHLYSEYSYYFLTTDRGAPAEAGTQAVPGEAPGLTINTFDGYDYHEENLYNLIKSGRRWFGEKIGSSSGFSTSFTFPGIITSSPVKIKIEVASQSGSVCRFTVNVNNQHTGTISVSGVSNKYEFAKTGSLLTGFSSNSENISLNIKYDGISTNDKGWLDYIDINAKQSLRYNNTPLFFRSTEAYDNADVVKYEISNAKDGLIVWDVTDPDKLKKMNTSISGSVISFVGRADKIREYVIFDRSGQFPSPDTDEEKSDIGSIENQDLHAVNPHEMIIVSHENFIDQAGQLADFHHEKDNMSVYVVTPEKIYNEFSSGKPDVSAIRDFLKMVYDHSTGGKNDLKYLLLFGDGSFDNMSNDPANTNYILTYQSENSLSETGSYVSDDFFGLLDDNEGEATGLLDIGIGRLPASSDGEDETEVQALVDKIIRYNTSDNMTDWRNLLCFMGDDGEFGDGSTYMNHASLLGDYAEQNYPGFTVDKILLDAYKQEITSTGPGYPDVKKAITGNLNRGMLIFNYLGHGSENGLTLEQVITRYDIPAWKNEQLPLFITATCEFSRFDDVDINEETGKLKSKPSAGELVLLNPDGGGIALLTTTRLAFGGDNFILNKNFFKYVFKRDGDNKKYRLGDLMRLTKNNTYGNNKLNFTLLGDPALELAWPEYNVITDSINGASVNDDIDTLKAFSYINVSGHVTDHDNVLMNDFHGTIYPSVFDKAVTSLTRGNDGIDPYEFSEQTNIIYKGKATVENGRFNFSFIIPKDIQYHFGKGKITYYAENSVIDAQGYFRDFHIGGTSDDVIPDYLGPDLNVYINDTNFRPGGITGKDPAVYAEIYDESGINRVGNGIGHDVVGVLDNDLANPFIMNDYYEAEKDNFRKGTLYYRLSNLEEGKHTLTVKVWDSYNNSSSKTIEFEVVNSNEFVIRNVFNYPNPVKDHTTFQFEHNRSGTGHEITIDIFDLSGKLVRSIRQEVDSRGYRSEDMTWDARSGYGSPVAEGIYIYRVRVKTSDNQIAEEYNKLLILK